MTTDKQKEIARRILAGGPPKFDPRSHFDGCPAREGAPICTCGGNRAHEGNTAKPIAMTAKTLKDAVRQVLDDAFPEFRVDQGNTNTAIAQDYVLGRLMPLLEAADALMPALADFREDMKRYPLPAEIDAVYDLMPEWFKARAALMWEGGMSKYFENCLSCNGECGHWTDDGEWTECGACDGMGGQWVQDEESPRIGDDEEME